MRMRLVCYWQGNTEQSWQLQEYLGFFREVQRGGVSPEGFELPVTSSPKPCRVGRAHTHVPLKDTAMISHPYLKTLRGTRGGTLSQVPTHTQAKGASLQRQISKCFGSATSENLLYAQLFTKKPTTILHRLSNLHPCTKSAFLGCLSHGFMLSVKQINYTVLIVCILSIFAAFPEKADMLLHFNKLYFLPRVLTHRHIVLFFIVIFRPNVVPLHKCLH